MAESKIATAVVPLNGTNYPTWKIQCKMALMKEGLWKIVTGEEVAPTGQNAAEQSKFAARKDRALASIVLSVDTSLLYLINDPTDPVVLWGESWLVNLKRRLGRQDWTLVANSSLQLKDGESAQSYD